MATTDSEPMVQRVGKMTVRTISDREAEITREFDAPRRLVWEAISKAEHIPHWWGPRRYTTISCQLDFRTGGSWRFVQRGPDGEEVAFRGEIREVVPPERVVQTFEFEGMPGAISVETLTLTEHDGRTLLRVRTAVDSVEALEAMLQSGMAEGAAETYDRLEEYLPTLA